VVEHILTTEFNTNTDLHSWIIANKNSITEIISINQRQEDRKWILWFTDKSLNDSEKESNEEFDKKMIGDKPRAFCKKCNGTGRSENGVLICSTCKGTGLNRKHRKKEVV